MLTCGPILSLVYYRAHIPEETTAMVVKFLLSIYSVNVDKRVSLCSLNQLGELENRSAISFGKKVSICILLASFVFYLIECIQYVLLNTYIIVYCNVVYYSIDNILCMRAKSRHLFMVLLLAVT